MDSDNDPTFQEVIQFSFDSVHRQNTGSKRNNRASKKAVKIRDDFKYYLQSQRLTQHELI